MFCVQVSKPDCRDVPREVCHPVVKQVPKQVPSKYCDKIEVKKCEPVPQKVRVSAFPKALKKLKHIALHSYFSNINNQHMASLSLATFDTLKSQSGATFFNGAYNAFIIVFASMIAPFDSYNFFY